VISPADFNPAPDLEAKLFEALISQHHSLASIAALAAISTEALSLWLARPAVRDRLAALESTAAWRIRLVSTLHLEATVATLTTHLKNPTLIQVASREMHELAAPSSPRSSSSHSSSEAPEDLRAALTGLRAAESLRRAASTLIRLTRFKPIGPTAAVAAPPIAPTHAAKSASSSEISSLKLPGSSSSPAFETSNPKSPWPPARPQARPSSAHRSPNISHRTSPSALLQSAGSARAP
jgi:hypothetical protein